MSDQDDGHQGDREVLSGGNLTPVVRVGDTVHREAGEWTPAVHRLLTHVREAGLTQVPRVHGTTADGHEVLDYLPGDVPGYPMPEWVWGSPALVSSARLLRRLHAATVDADRTGPWRSTNHEPAEVVCHNDFAPYNLVFHDGVAVGVIDFDHASPGPRLWDLAYLAYRIVPLTTDRGDGFTAAERAARVRILLQEYGAAASPAELVDVVVRRLLELADYSETMAVSLGRPELADHAALYRADAAALG